MLGTWSSQQPLYNAEGTKNPTVLMEKKTTTPEKCSTVRRQVHFLDIMWKQQGGERDSQFVYQVQISITHSSSWAPQPSPEELPKSWDSVCWKIMLYHETCKEIFSSFHPSLDFWKTSEIQIVPLAILK